MNMHKLRGVRTTASGALLVTGMAFASGWLSTAHAQELGFAHKLMGAPASGSESIQFRSTIIDPSRAGKTMNTGTTKFRVIPVSNPEEISASKHSCAICGVVESISLTVNDGPRMEPDGESAMENVAIIHSNRPMLRTYDRKIVTAGNGANKSPKKQAPLYEVKVRMSDGTIRIVSQPTQPEYAVGDYVRVISGAVTAA